MVFLKLITTLNSKYKRDRMEENENATTTHLFCKPNLEQLTAYY